MKLERIIANRFNSLASTFPASIEENDARLRAIVEACGPLKGKRVLEVGCGKGRVCKILASKGASVHGIDISEKLLREAPPIRESYFLCAEAYRLPFKSGSFDIVFAMEVIEHIPDTSTALREMARVLSPQGKMIIVDRNKFSLNNRRFLAPNLLIKLYHERKNEWMYPRGFPYRERWYGAREICLLMKKSLRKVAYRHVLSDGEDKSRWRIIFRACPLARHFILWSGTDKYGD